MTRVSITLAPDGREALRCWANVPSLIHSSRDTPCRNLVPLDDPLGLCPSCKRKMARQ